MANNNTYTPRVKAYPDLMKGRTIMYVHGFASSACSGTVRRLRATFPNATVVARDMPVDMNEALQWLRQLCQEHKPDLIVGTSMGGMLTERMRGYNRICVNPAMAMGDTMEAHHMIGMQQWMNPREDGAKEFLVTKAMAKEVKALTDTRYADLPAAGTPQWEQEQERVWGLFGDEDNVVDTYGEFSAHYRQAAHFHGGHRMDDSSFIHGVLPVIRWVSDRLDGIERPTVALAWDCLPDSYGNPTSSLAKAVSFLIERYKVLVVAPSLTERPEQCQQVIDWVQRHLGTALHNRVVFTSMPETLMADYWVGAAKPAGFMGTAIAWGSDEFKTWEEVITYFDLLGGQ